MEARYILTENRLLNYPETQPPLKNLLAPRTQQENAERLYVRNSIPTKTAN